MQHKIGMNYKEIIKSRKNKHQYPHVGKLKTSIDLEKLRQEVLYLLNNNVSDSSTTETQYRLNKNNGDKFIKDYEEFIKNYSSITFNKITDEAEAYAKTIVKPLDEFSPLDRLKGMIDTGGKHYHPYYDERNYTVFTDQSTGYIREILENFESTACRAAIVLLRPGQRITRHFDVGPEFIIRTHIPLWTNLGAKMGFKVDGGWQEYHLPADGGIYAVNTGIEHWAMNVGGEPRFQMRICLTSQEDTEGMETVDPISFISDEDFKGHLCS
jgi:hypothetical protein